MTKPEYLISYSPYARDVVQGIHKVIGDTEKYWKCQLCSDGTTFLIRKSNLKVMGGDTQYYVWTKAQVDEYRYKSKLLKKVKRVNLSLLSTKQLEEILKIAEGGENAISDIK